MSYTTIKTHKKQHPQWKHVIQKWGHSIEALYDLYHEADEKDNENFKKYLKQFIKEYEQKEKLQLAAQKAHLQKELELKNKTIQRANHFKEYKWDISKSNKVKLVDIMIEQANPFNYITT